MIVRPVKEEDLITISELEAQSYPVPWTLQNFIDDYANDFAFMFVLEEKDLILGYGGFWLLYDIANITKLTIHPLLRGKGLGEILLNDLIGRMKSQDVINIVLEVRVSNQKAINLYEKVGFIKDGIRKRYYSDGEDAHLMILKVKEENE